MTQQRHSMSLKSWMQRDGWSCYRLAVELGVTESSVERWRSCRYWPSRDHMQRIAELSGDLVDPCSFFRESLTAPENAASRISEETARRKTV